jgi:MYXO-CTERM domain-containing protein
MNTRIASLAALSVLASASAATAAVNYSTSFESPFTTAALPGQQGWATTGASGNFIVGNVAGRARTGTQYVGYDYTTGTSTTSRLSWIAQTQTAAQLATDPIVTMSTWVQILTPAAGTTRVTGGGLAAYSSTGSFLASTRIRSDGALVVASNFGTSGVAGALSITNFAFGTYYQVSMTLNYSTNRVSFAINGSAVNTSAITGLDTFVGTTFGDADLYITRSNPTTGTATGGHFVTFDDYSVTSTPAPGSIALLAVAGIVGSRRRR